MGYMAHSSVLFVACANFVGLFFIVFDMSAM